MNVIGTIHSEGGPLIIADGRQLMRWQGIDGADYARACAVFDADASIEGAAIEIDAGATALLWEVNGPGSTYVVASGDDIVLIKAWLDEDEGNPLSTILELAAEDSVAERMIGEISIQTGALAIMWATENGEAIASAISKGMPNDNSLTSIDDSSLVLNVRDGILTARFSNISGSRIEGQLTARRLRLSYI